MKRPHSPYYFLLGSCIAFLVLLSIGMLFYPGGTLLDHSTKGYGFFANFISELGRWRSFTGETQWVSFTCFEIALLMQSACMFFFNGYFLTHTESKRLSPGAHYTALVFGSLFPVMLAGIALTPCDLYLPYHMFFVRVGFAMLLPLSIAYTILIRKHHMLPNKYGNVMLSIVVAIGLYLVMIFFGPNPREVAFVQQTAQKLIVIAMIGSLLYLSTGCIKYLATTPEAK